MARRPVDVRGRLVFQEGKIIDDGDCERSYYIVSVYDDPAGSSVYFAAYELENDSTYVLPYSYSEFDEIFRFNSDLMNPNNTDGRYHWVIERLDFVVEDYLGTKKLVLATQPTKDFSADEAEIFQMSNQGKAQGGEGGEGASIQAQSFDPALRQQLIRELEAFDDHHIHVNLVKSEGARTKFLQELHAKRRLEQLKATQRMIRLDEDKEERIAKMKAAKVAQAAKALKFKEVAQGRSQTVADIERMMRKKEFDHVRKLLKKKKEEEAAREERREEGVAKRANAEQSFRQLKAQEEERARVLAQRRVEAILQRGAMLKKMDRQVAESRQKMIEAESREKIRKAESRGAYIQELENQARDKAELEREKQEDWLAKEELREQNEAVREERRNERGRLRSNALVKQKNQFDIEKQTRLLMAKEKAVEQHKSDLVGRAEERKRLERINLIRERNIEVAMEMRTRLRQERETREEAKRYKKIFQTLAYGDDAGEEELVKATSPEERKTILKSTEAFKRKEEARKFQIWQHEQQRKAVDREQKKVDREEAKKKEAEIVRERENAEIEKWNLLEQARDEKLTKMAGDRLGQTVQKVHKIRAGTASVSIMGGTKLAL